MSLKWAPETAGVLAFSLFVEVILIDVILSFLERGYDVQLALNT